MEQRDACSYPGFTLKIQRNFNRQKKNTRRNVKNYVRNMPERMSQDMPEECQIERNYEVR